MDGNQKFKLYRLAQIMQEMTDDVTEVVKAEVKRLNRQYRSTMTGAITDSLAR